MGLSIPILSDPPEAAAPADAAGLAGALATVAALAPAEALGFAAAAEAGAAPAPGAELAGAAVPPHPAAARAAITARPTTRARAERIPHLPIAKVAPVYTIAHPPSSKRLIAQLGHDVDRERLVAAELRVVVAVQAVDIRGVGERALVREHQAGALVRTEPAGVEGHPRRNRAGARHARRRVDLLAGIRPAHGAAL